MISGRGSNLGALLEASRVLGYPAEISLVISNDSRAKGLDLARDAGVTTAVFDNRDYGKDRRGQEKDIHASLMDHGIELVVLAGYMRVLGGDFVGRWRQRMLNIHPSLLPNHPGLHTHERALANGDALHGCTVHWATAELDAGPVIAQATVPIMQGDTAEALAARVLEQEHVLLPSVVSTVCKKLLMEERIVAAALRCASGVHALAPPNRHHDVIRWMLTKGVSIVEISRADQGFLTDRGRYVDREDALAIALAARQIYEERRPVPDLPELFSEDLW